MMSCGCNPDDCTGHPMEERHGGSRLSRLRWWLIRRLARGDLIYINAITTTPPGWSVSQQHIDQGAYINNNVFNLNPHAPVVPGTRILSTYEEAP